MKVAICVIGRLENRYAVEFVEYHKKLGIDHIFIGDNNYDGEEYFEDVLQQYIDEDFVTIIPYRNRQNVQEVYYWDCYKTYHTYYNYFIFIDFDEYIHLVKDKNIKEYLSRNINNYNVIQLNWMIYTDNDLIYDDGRPCLKRFVKPMNLYKIIYNFPENYHVKSIIKCDFDSISFCNPHSIDIKEPNNIPYKVCNNSFKDKYLIDMFIECNENKTIDYSLAYVKHFLTKTIDEYVNNKRFRGTIEGGVEDFKDRYKNKFFRINKLTPEKKEYCLKNKINFDLL